MAGRLPMSALTSLTPVPNDAEAPTVQFESVHKLYEAIRQAPGDIIIFKNVSPRDFDAVEKVRDSSRPKFRARRYYVDKNILIVTIPTFVHEQLHLALYQQYIVKLARAGNAVQGWMSVGSTTYRSGGHPRGDGGEGDSCGGPRKAILRREWPTLVIEAGASESLSQLTLDMDWWFRASNHQVQIVLLVKFDHLRQQIFMQKYEEERPRLRQGAMTTRTSSAAPLAPVLRENIVIGRNAGSNSFNVTSGPLVLRFEKLFLRVPDPSQGEEDVVFSDAELQRYAEAVWRTN